MKISKLILSFSADAKLSPLERHRLRACAQFDRACINYHQHPSFPALHRLIAMTLTTSGGSSGSGIRRSILTVRIAQPQLPNIPL